jgi:hypothetical protein
MTGTVYLPSSLRGKSVTGIAYLDMLKLQLFPKLLIDFQQELLIQQDGIKFPLLCFVDEFPGSWMG